MLKIKSKRLKKALAYLGMVAGFTGATLSLVMCYHTKIGALFLVISCALFIASAIYEENLPAK